MHLCNTFKMPDSVSHIFYFNSNSRLTKPFPLTSQTIQDKYYFTFHQAHHLVPGKCLQGGFFGGSYSKFYHFCDLHAKQVANYMKRKLMPTCDDETCLNDIVYNLLKPEDCQMFDLFYTPNMKV